MSALKAIQNPSYKSGQRIVHAISQATKELKARGIPLRLQWIPGHYVDPGNDAADLLAKEAVGLKETHPFRHLVSREKGYIRYQIMKDWEREWKTSKNGGHLRQIDTTLPSIHARRLYDPLPRPRAYLLTQLHTGHSFLATYAKRRRFSENDQCECGARETVAHVLMECPKLSTLRRSLQQQIRESFGNISFMFGGKSQQESRGKPAGMSQGSVLNAVLDFAEASGRFRSRGSRGPQRKKTKANRPPQALTRL